MSLYTYSLQRSLFLYNATGHDHSTNNIVKNTPGAQLNVTFDFALLVGTSPTDPTAACRVLSGSAPWVFSVHVLHQ